MTFQPERTGLRIRGRQADTPLIALIGSKQSFTPGMQSLIELDVGEVRTLRVPSLAALQYHLHEAGGGRARVPALVVVAEALADDLCARFEAYRKVSARGVVALAYRSAERARAFRDAMAEKGGVPPDFVPPGFVPPGFVPLGAAIEVWLLAMRLNLCGEPYLPQELVWPPAAPTISSPPEAGAPQGDAALGQARLTAREREVLPLVAEGRSTKGIARDLGLSQHTVKLHIHNIFSKIGVRNRASATRWYLSRVANPGWGAHP